MWKKVLLGVLVVIVLVAAGVGAYAFSEVSAFDSSVGQTYDLPLPTVERSTDPAVIARGKHITESIGACIACHGDNLGGGKVEDLGPLGRIVYPNITPGKNSAIAGYTDAELARLLRHGVKKNGKTALMMPSQEFYWWPDADRVAVISYLRTLPPVDSEPASIEITAMAKVLDRMDSIPLDVARRVDHEAAPPAIEPAPTAEYGKLLAIGCTGCHGEKHMAGGPIPGAPPEIPTPLNLTPHETGLAGWTYEDFDKVIETGVRKDGRKLDEFMPIIALRNMNETERKAIFAYLQSLPPVPFGER